MVASGGCPFSHGARRRARLQWGGLLGSPSRRRRCAPPRRRAWRRPVMTSTNLDSATILILAIVGVLAALALVTWLRRRGNQSERLQQRFGPEYERAVEHLGSREKAEAELLAREQRVERLHIVPLAPADAARYAQTWMLVQGRFVDSPRGALVEADRLVRELMLQRGYPMGNFERRAADISVDHPAVVDHYRTAH